MVLDCPCCSFVDDILGKLFYVNERYYKQPSTTTRIYQDEMWSISFMLQYRIYEWIATWNFDRGVILWLFRWRFDILAHTLIQMKVEPSDSETFRHLAQSLIFSIPGSMQCFEEPTLSRTKHG